VNFGAAHDNAIGPFVHDADIIIRVFLRRWRPAAVPFHVGLRHGHSQVVLGAIAVKVFDAAQIIRLMVIVHIAGQHVQGVEGIRADLFDQHHQGAPQAGSGFDELAALQEVFAVAGQGEIAAAGLARFGIRNDGQVAVARVFGHAIIDARVLDRDA
jgi:hypothetical protein